MAEEDVDQAIAIPLSDTLRVRGFVGEKAAFSPGVLYVGIRGTQFLKHELLFARLFAKVITHYLIQSALAASWSTSIRNDLRQLRLLSWYLDSDENSKQLISKLRQAMPGDVALILVKVGRGGDADDLAKGIVPKDARWARLISKVHIWVSQKLKQTAVGAENDARQLPLIPGYQPATPWSVHIYQRDVLAIVPGLGKKQCEDIAVQLKTEIADKLAVFGGPSRTGLEVLMVWLPSTVVSTLLSVESSHLGKSRTELFLDEQFGKLKAHADTFASGTVPLLILDAATRELTSNPTN